MDRQPLEYDLKVVGGCIMGYITHQHRRFPRYSQKIAVCNGIVFQSNMYPCIYKGSGGVIHVQLRGLNKEMDKALIKCEFLGRYEATLALEKIEEAISLLNKKYKARCNL